MKKLFFSAFVLLLVSNAYAFSGPGDGSAGNPYQIETCAHLQEIEDEKDAVYALTRNIDCNGFDFTPISAPFSGVLNGYGWTISDFTLNEATGTGMFMSVSGTIKNLTIDNADVTGSGYTGIVARTMSGGTIQDVAVTNSTVTGAGYTVGGIVGDMGTGDVVERVKVIGTTVTGTAGNMGGIVGVMGNTAIVREAYTQSTTITGDQEVGGIVGVMLHDSLVENSGSRATVTTDGTLGGAVGGIVGEMWHDSILRNSFHGEGTITANNGVDGGGLVGEVVHGNTITASYYHDAITCTGCTNTTGQTAIENLTQANLEPQGWDFDDVWFDHPDVIEDFPSLRTHTFRFLTPHTGIGYPGMDTTPSLVFVSSAPGSIFTYGGSCSGGLEFPAWGLNTITFQELAPGLYTDCTIQMTMLGGGGEGIDIESNILEISPFRIVDTNFAGSGTENDPYQVDDCYKLQGIENDVIANYQLTEDIDCSETPKWNFGAGFDPIMFLEGMLDGQEYSISGLVIVREENAGFTGLFGSIQTNGIVRNLILEAGAGFIQGSIESGEGGTYSATGALAGINAGTITNVHSNVPVEGHIHVGGLAGWNLGTIDVASTSGEVIALGDESFILLGGIAGGISGNSSITNTFSTATFITDDSWDGDIVISGGIVAAVMDENFGDCDAQIISNSYAETHSEALMGAGIVGWVNHNNPDCELTIENVFSDSTFDIELGETTVNGILAFVEDDSAVTITNAYFDEDNEGYPFDPLTCHWTLGDEDITVNSCTAWDSETTPDYLKNTHTDEPVDTWDFENIWRLQANSFPKFSGNTPSEEVDEEEEVQTNNNSSGGSGKGGTIRWRGMARDDLLNFGGKVTKHNFDEYYAKSKQQIAQMNEGFAPAQQYMVNRWGEHVFAGYLAGRIGLDRFPHRYQNIVRFGSGSLSAGRGVVIQSEPMPTLASAPKGIEDIMVLQPTNQGWADEYQLAKDRFQQPVKDESLFASAPVAMEKVSIQEDQVATHENQRNYYRKKGIVDRKRDTSMLAPSRMDATKDMNTVQIRMGGKSVPMSNYLQGSQSSLFGSPQQSEQGAYFWMLIIGAFIIAGVGASYLFKRK